MPPPEERWQANLYHPALYDPFPPRLTLLDNLRQLPFAWSCAFATPLGSYLERAASFGASEATIFSKRGSPRKGSHSGLSRKFP